MVKDALDVYGYNFIVVDMPESLSKASQTGSALLQVLASYGSHYGNLCW
jgi:hypothetical protein